jgi:hypothetical protein
MIKPVNKKKIQPIEIVPVGNDELGYYYFAKLGYIKGGERDQLTEVEVLRQESTFTLDSLVSAIALDRGITKPEASALVFGKGNSEVISMSELHQLYPDQTKQFLERSNNQKIKLIVATLLIKGYYTNTAKGTKFIPGRSAYPFTVVNDTEAGDTSILLKNCSCSIYAGQSIKFDNQAIVVIDNLILPVDTISQIKIQVQQLEKPLKKDAIGFLYSASENSYVLGDASWSESDTCELEYELLSLIYDFYDNESNGWPVTEVEKPEADDEQLEVSSPLEAPLLTGQTSIIDSKPLELPTIA